jgi:hypothetical protein
MAINVPRVRLSEVASITQRAKVFNSSYSAPSAGTINLYASKSDVDNREIIDAFLSYDGRPFCFVQDVKRGKTTHTYISTHGRNLIHVFNRFYAGAFLNDIFTHVFSHLDLGTPSAFNILLSSLEDARGASILKALSSDYEEINNLFPIAKTAPSSEDEMIEALSSAYEKNDVSITIEEIRRESGEIYFSGSADVKWSHPFSRIAFKFRTHFNGQFTASRKALNFTDPVAWTDQSIVQAIISTYDLRNKLKATKYGTMYDKVTSTSTFLSAQDGAVFMSILGIGKPFKLKKSPVKAPKPGSPKTDWPMSLLPPKILGTDPKYFDYWVESMQALQRLRPELQEWQYDPTQPKSEAALSYEEAIRWFYRYMRDNYGVLDIISYIRNERSKDRGAKTEVKELPETVRNQIKIQVDNFYSTLRGLKDSISRLKRNEQFSDQVAERANQFFKELESYNLIKAFGIKTFRLGKSPTVDSANSWVETLEYSKSLIDAIVSTVKEKAKGRKEAVRSAESVQKLIDRSIVYFKQQLGMDVETPEQKSQAKQAAQDKIPYRRRQLLQVKGNKEGMVTQVSPDDRTVTLKMVEDQKTKTFSWDDVKQVLDIPFRGRDIVRDKEGNEWQVRSVRPNKKSVMAVPADNPEGDKQELKWQNIEFVRH